MKLDNSDQPINGYSVSRRWFDFAFENQGQVTGNHGCMLMWFVEQNNRYGWVKSFGIPREQTMAAVGISSYTTYKKVFDDLVDWGFVTVIQRSKNQFTANIIALSNNDIAEYKALDNALRLQSAKQFNSNSDGTVSLNKQLNNKPFKVVEEETVVVEGFFENHAEAALYLYESKIFEAAKTKYNIDDQKTLEIFKIFFEQKAAFDELRKTKEKFIENFFYWIPKHLGAQVTAKGGRKNWE